MQHWQISQGSTRQDHTDHAGKCQQQTVREFAMLRKRVGQMLKARRLSPLVTSAASRQQDWLGLEPRKGRGGQKSGRKQHETNSLLLCAPCRQMSINLFI